jgi:hypothetical protein
MMTIITVHLLNMTLKLTMNELEYQLKYYYKRHIILEVDSTNTCKPTVIKALQIYCCEWSCNLWIFQKFRVCFH